MEYSPLFWPIEFKGTKISILDETVLPHKLVYIDAHTYQDACDAIRQMKTRAVGQVLLVMYTFLLVEEQNAGNPDIKGIFKNVADSINASRPTLPFKVLTDMVLSWVEEGKDIKKSIYGFLEMLKQKRVGQARLAAEMLENGDNILTHCNISGLMPLIGHFCKEMNKEVKFFVTETRPYFQGLRLTAWELEKAGLDTTIICDSMVAQVMHERKVSKIIVGADHLAQNGDIANKIGTYQIAILAKHFSIPMYVICPPPSRLKSGSEIKIEIRPDHEVLKINGEWISSTDAKAYYPAFDVTPAELITKYIYL